MKDRCRDYYRMNRVKSPAIGLCFIWFCVGWMLANCASAEERADALSDEEQLFVAALDDIRGERLDSALETLETLLAKHPNFRLAHMVYADILLAKVSPITPFGTPLETHTGVVSALKDEAMKRFSHHRDVPRADQIPEQLLELAKSVPEVVVVDVSASRFYLFENHDQGLRLVNDYYVSTGKMGAKKVREGDHKTPVGVYFITGRIPPSELPDFYGTGALPVNYPNEWDLLNGRTGYGIWIHGVPSDTYSRSPRASDGCMVLANGDLAAMWNLLAEGGTPVIVTDGTRWMTRDYVVGRRREIRDQIEAWKGAWESLNISRYAAFYSEEFRSNSKTLSEWIQHKTKVNRSKQFIDVELKELSILGYPGEDDMVLVSFTQDYRSSNFSSLVDKRQYWKREADGTWRIIYEGKTGTRERDPLLSALKSEQR